jgi:hypothetical protein
MTVFLVQALRYVRIITNEPLSLQSRKGNGNKKKKEVVNSKESRKPLRAARNLLHCLIVILWHFARKIPPTKDITS